MFARLFSVPKVVITNNDIKNLNIIELNTLKSNPNNNFQLTCSAMQHAYDDNNMDKLKYLHHNFGLNLPTFGGFHLDKAVENGDSQTAKFLVDTFKYQPSLYAKQMGSINGHHDLVSWMDINTTQRNDTGIAMVHYKYNQKTKQMEWPSWIPEEYRKL